MLDYATLRTKDLGQEAAPSADIARGNARAKAVRASYEFWSSGNEALLEQAFAAIFFEHTVRPLHETTALGPIRRAIGGPEKGLKMNGSG